MRWLMPRPSCTLGIMDEAQFDAAAMGRLAKAVSFICGAEHACTQALAAAAESGAEKDVKKARALFLKLRPNQRQAALTMLED